MDSAVGITCFEKAFRALLCSLGLAPGEYVRLAQQLFPSLLLLTGGAYYEALFRMAALNDVATKAEPRRPGRAIGYEHSQLHVRWPDGSVTCHYPDELCPALP